MSSRHVPVVASLVWACLIAPGIAQTAPRSVVKAIVNAAGGSYQEGSVDGTGTVIPQFACSTLTHRCSILPGVLDGVPLGVTTPAPASVTNLTVQQSAGPGTATALSVADSGLAPWQYPKFNFIGHEHYLSLPGAGIGAAVQGLEVQMFKDPTPGVTTSGGRQAFTVAQSGVLGGPNDEFGGGFEAVMPTVDPNGNNNSGYIYGNNPSVLIPPGLTPTVVYAEKVDMQNHSPTIKRAGIDILDIDSTVAGSASDAAIATDKNPGSLGFFHGLIFGTDGASFPITAGGTFLTTGISSTALDSFLDFSHMATSPTTGGIVFRPGGAARSLCWGVTRAGNCPGGQIGSSASATGGGLLFGNAVTSFQFAGASVLTLGAGLNESVVPMKFDSAVQFAVVDAATLPACSPALEGTEFGVTNATSATFNAPIAAGGANHVKAYCNGTGWTVH